MKQPQNRKLKIAHAYKSNTTAIPAPISSIQANPFQDQIRHLKNDLDRYKVENQEILEEKSDITQQYLLAKSQVQEVLQQLESMKSQLQSQDDIIQKRVEVAISKNHNELLNCNKQQIQIIQKLKQQKSALCKNIQDLQESLKSTRIELQHTQKTLFQLQNTDKCTINNSDQVPKEPICTSNNIIFTNTNKIQNFPEKMDNFEEIDQQIWNTGNLKSKYGKQRELGSKRLGEGRGTLSVAKSLAIHRTPNNKCGDSDLKYNWLFNDEETPRDSQNDGLDLKAKQGNNRSYKYVEPPENPFGQDVSNFAVHTDARKSGKSTAFEPDSMQSERSNINDGLIGGRNEWDKSKQNSRPSLVDKSLQGMKNIFKMTKTGDTNGMKGLSHYGQNRESFACEIDHESVDLELKSHKFSEHEQNPLEDDYN